MLRRFSKHYLTGEIIPEKLVKSMQAARDMFAATELQRQVYICQPLPNDAINDILCTKGKES